MMVSFGTDDFESVDLGPIVTAICAALSDTPASVQMVKSRNAFETISPGAYAILSSVFRTRFASIFDLSPPQSNGAENTAPSSNVPATLTSWPSQALPNTPDRDRTPIERSNDVAMSSRTVDVTLAIIS